MYISSWYAAHDVGFECGDCKFNK